MKKKMMMMVFMAGFMLISLTVYAQDDVKIDNSGNVTTGVSANGKLEVIGSSAGKAIVGLSSGTGGSGVYGESTDNGYGVQGLSSSGTGGYFNSTSGYGLIVGTGNVGIGTGTPAYSLDVAGTINASTAIKINGTDVLTSYTETDPTVAASVKDGVDWTELSGIPAGFADNTDDDTTYSAGTGLDLTGTIFSVEVPLALSGNQPHSGIISGVNSSSDGQGVYGVASGISGVGVWGRASSTGAANNYGGYFEAAGVSGKGVRGTATGTNGVGVVGLATAAGDVVNYGGYFDAAGNSGRGVYGSASSTGAVTNYGGYFDAAGDDGRGVYGHAYGTKGIGVYGLSTTGIGGYFTSTSGNGLIVENGFVGIGTTMPSSIVEVARDQAVPRILATGYRDAFSAGDFTGRKARGTMASPAGVQTEDVLASFGGYGFYDDGGVGGWPIGSTAVKARMQIVAAQNWTDTAQGAYIKFLTTPIDSLTRAEVMRITDTGDVGIGTTSPQSTLQVNGYTQLALTSGAPPSADCDETAERGRMKVDNVNGLLYICVDSGWVSK